MKKWPTLKISDIDGTWYLLVGMIRDVKEVEPEFLTNMNNEEMKKFILGLDLKELKDAGERINVNNNKELEISWMTEFTKEEYLKDSKASVFNTRDEKDKIARALELAFSYSQIDGEHHKSWVIDQMVKTLTGKEGFEVFIEKYEEKDCDGIPQYEWSEGVAP